MKFCGGLLGDIYDPDGHIIEVGEPMTAVATRFKESGMNISQIAERMDVKEEYVREWLEDNAGDIQ